MVRKSMASHAMEAIGGKGVVLPIHGLTLFISNVHYWLLRTAVVGVVNEKGWDVFHPPAFLGVPLIKWGPDLHRGL